MYRQDEPEVNFEQISSRIKGIFGRFGFGGGGGGLVYAILGVIVVGSLGWLATGFYTVEPAEVAALRRFGIFEDTAGPGLHWWWPNPIGTRAIVDVRQRRRLEIGVRGDAPFLEESLMITGDENIVDVQLLVQFEIKDVEEFLFRAVDPCGEDDQGRIRVRPQAGRRRPHHRRRADDREGGRAGRDEGTAAAAPRHV